MITIFTALYCEAEPIIQYFDLKRQDDINGFQLFSRDPIHLLITGVGSINAAIGVTSLCSSSLYAPDFGDIIVNIGICGTKNLSLGKGSLLLGKKIIDLSTYRAYYPDMIFEHEFTESTILTSPVPVTGSVNNSAIVHSLHTEHSSIYAGSTEISMTECAGLRTQSFIHKDNTNTISNEWLSDAINLFATDMEASGIFHAAKLFYQPHQMFFFKVVSDYHDGEKLRKQDVLSLISDNIGQIAKWILPIHDELQSRKPMVFSEQEKALLNRTAESLRLTVSMQFQLKGLLHYYKIKNGDFTRDLEQFLKENIKQTCKNKNEGKKYFEKLRKSFL